MSRRLRRRSAGPVRSLGASGSPGSDKPQDGSRPALRPLSEVTCWRCERLGHYANKCPKLEKEEDVMSKRLADLEQQLAKRRKKDAAE